MCTVLGVLGIAALVSLGTSALVARWQYYGPQRATRPLTFTWMAGSAVVASAAWLSLWLGRC